MCQNEMQITPLVNESVICDWYFVMCACYDCYPVVYPLFPPEENVMENVTLTITYRWCHPHYFSSMWWLIFLYHNWCKLNFSHLQHIHYTVSPLAIRTRTAQLLGERLHWRGLCSIYCVLPVPARNWWSGWIWSMWLPLNQMPQIPLPVDVLSPWCDKSDRGKAFC